MTIISEERNYRELKESTRMMNSQRSDTEKKYLIEEDKKIGVDEVSNSLKSEIKKATPSYCLKCRKNTENINPRVSKTSNGKTMYYQIVLYVVAKN